MPLYEYRAVGRGCGFCRRSFEARQGMNDAPLQHCPRCGGTVRKLFSRSFICVSEPLSETDNLVKRTEEQADRSGLSDGFGEDRIYQ